MSTIAKKWIEQGMQQGMQQGVRQGIEQGTVNVLLRILNRRFGNLDPMLETRIRRLPAKQLYQITDIALDASSLEAVIAFLNTLPESKL